MQSGPSNLPEVFSKPTTQTSAFITEPVIVYPHTWLRKEIPSIAGVKKLQKRGYEFCGYISGGAEQFLTPFKVS